MRKLLSILLVLAMVLALTPMALAHSEIALQQIAIVLYTPRVGQKIEDVEAFISNTNACEIGWIEWRDYTEDHMMEAGETFRAGHEYYAYVCVECSNGYVVAYSGSGADMKFTATATVNGNPATVFSHVRNPREEGFDPHYAKILTKVGYVAAAISGGVKTVSKVIYYGDTISCTVTGDATDIPASKLHYQWQLSVDKTNWTNVAGATSASWTTPSTGTATNYTRVVVTADGYTGQLVSDTHALNVKSSTATELEGSVTIRQSSETETSFRIGKEVTGSFVNTAGIVSTAPSLRYQWQRSLSNTNWEDISGSTGRTYTPTDADEGYWLRMKVTSIYSVGELYSGAKQISSAPTALTFSADARSAKASGDWAGMYARVALVLDNGGVSGLYITQATINSDGTILVPEFIVPGLTVKGVNISLVPTLADIQSSTPNIKATASRML